MAKIVDLWREGDDNVKNVIKFVGLFFVIIVVVTIVSIFVMTKVNSTIAVRAVTHPTPDITCVELTSFKDVSISCVANKVK